VRAALAALAFGGVAVLAPVGVTLLGVAAAETPEPGLEAEQRAYQGPVTSHGPGGWGGYGNGLIPSSVLCPVGSAQRLRCDAADSFQAMSAAYALAFGRPFCITDGYRTLAAQIDVKRRKPGLAATPGTSNHGWALAVDLCGGVERFGTPAHQWMRANASRYGWHHPRWAQAGGSKPEAWHWEYGGRS
jgi:hypothetical protein